MKDKKLKERLISDYNFFTVSHYPIFLAELSKFWLVGIYLKEKWLQKCLQISYFRQKIVRSAKPWCLSVCRYKAAAVKLWRCVADLYLNLATFAAAQVDHRDSAYTEHLTQFSL